jgi:thioredoxin-related protein
VKGPPRPDERKRCLDTPPFFFYEKVGEEIVVLSCNYLLDEKSSQKINSPLMDHPPVSYRDFADIAIARLATPPFFFYEKVGGEIVVLSCNYLLDEKSN